MGNSPKIPPMTEEQKQTRLDSFVKMLPLLELNVQSTDEAHKAILNGMLKSTDMTAYTASFALTGSNFDEARDELERVQTVIAYIQSTPADQLTELSIGAQYAKS